MTEGLIELWAETLYETQAKREARELDGFNPYVPWAKAENEVKAEYLEDADAALAALQQAGYAVVPEEERDRAEKAEAALSKLDDQEGIAALAVDLLTAEARVKELEATLEREALRARSPGPDDKLGGD